MKQALQNTGKIIDRTPKYTPLTKIINALKKNGSVTDAAKVLGLARQTIYDRIERANLDIQDFLDYTDDKALSHEIMQYRIAKGLTNDDIKKMNGGSKVLAICQLEDKIEQKRGGNTGKNNISIVLNLACQSHETIDISVDNPVDK